MQMSLNLQAALLARAVCWQAHADETLEAMPFYLYDTLDACDSLDQNSYWALVNFLEAIAILGE